MADPPWQDWLMKTKLWETHRGAWGTKADGKLLSDFRVQSQLNQVSASKTAKNGRELAGMRIVECRVLNAEQREFVRHSWAGLPGLKVRFCLHFKFALWFARRMEVGFCFRSVGGNAEGAKQSHASRLRRKTSGISLKDQTLAVKHGASMKFDLTQECQSLHP
jgi:hypothetical protein